HIEEEKWIKEEHFNINKTGRQSGRTAGRSPSDHCSRNMTMKWSSSSWLCCWTAACLSSSTSPKDCSDIYNHDSTRPSGVYTIYPIGSISAVQVFQRRMDGSVNFYRPWDHYKTGFGNAGREYWLGLENLFHLTLRKKYELLVDMEDFEGGKVFARYSSFSVAPESSGFTLHVSGFTDGGAGDSLSNHNGSKFSTFDKDQDTWTSNCARSFLGGFWYGKGCHITNPNGVYRWGLMALFLL
ncbi:hypothetical protein F7725_013712, partial [Dissostichus mawsoni]